MPYLPHPGAGRGRLSHPPGRKLSTLFPDLRLQLRINSEVDLRIRSTRKSPYHRLHSTYRTKGHHRLHPVLECNRWWRVFSLVAPPFGRSSNVETYLECKRPTPSAVTLTPLFPAPRGGIAYALRPQGFWPAPLGRDLSMAPCGAAEKAFRIKKRSAGRRSCCPPWGWSAMPGAVST